MSIGDYKSQHAPRPRSGPGGRLKAPPTAAVGSRRLSLCRRVLAAGGAGWAAGSSDSRLWRHQGALLLQLSTPARGFLAEAPVPPGSSPLPPVAPMPRHG